MPVMIVEPLDELGWGRSSSQAGLPCCGGARRHIGRLDSTRHRLCLS